MTAKIHPRTRAELPESFSLVSAQKGPEADPAAHAAMRDVLQKHGFKVTEVQGHYGHPEPSFMVEGTEDPAKRAFLEDLAFNKNGQESVLHSVKLKNELVGPNGPMARGTGMIQGPHLNSYMTELPTGHKVRLLLKPVEAESSGSEPVEKSDDSIRFEHERGDPSKIPTLKVRAIHPSHGEVGHVDFEQVGGDWEPQSTYVHPDHRRKGIATGMYDYARKTTGMKVIPSQSQTSEGKSLWSKVKKSDDYGKKVEDKKKQISNVINPHLYGQINGVHVFHATHDAHRDMIGKHLHDPSDDELRAAIGEGKPVIIHGNPPALLRESALPKPHPHNYDWHETHTQHHIDDLSQAFREDRPIEKAAGDPVSLVHHSGNEQVQGKGNPTYPPIAKEYGELRQHPTNLQFYRGLEKKQPEIDRLTQKHGFTPYIAGGPHGKPDLAKRNFNTGHLMIWHPEAGSGGDYNDANFTKAWRQTHELAHALTYPQINAKYGEGRRIGALGTRTLPEAHRAVEWEWMAGHKQRELAKELGHEISDQDFAKEMNTLMHDAVHRAIHGKFAEPNEEGFWPHNELIPLDKAHAMIDDAAQKKGLTLKKAFTQGDGETLTDPRSHQAAAGPIPAHIMAWGVANLMPMAPDSIGVFDLNGRIIKVRKVLADLYSGWVEHGGATVHSWEKSTMPEVLAQLQSKLEWYGGEKAVGEDENKEHEMEEAAEVEELSDISAKLKSIQERVERFKGHEASEVAEVIDTKDLTPGIENPEKECPACERPIAQCICFMGLPNPRLEFDGRKITVFFKSEWSEDDRSNFKNDLIKRAGGIIQRRMLAKAQKVADEIKRRIKK